MNNISSQQILSQIRTLNAELQATDFNQMAGVNQVASSSQPGFGALLTDAIGQVNKTQMQATEMKQAYETGASSASLAEVMIATQKADLSFRAMTEVRNKLVTAYQDIMNMPV